MTTQGPSDGTATLVQRRQEEGLQSSSVFELVATSGPNRGETFSVDPSHPSRLLVGQSPSCEVRLRDPEASRRHAAIEPTAGGLRIADLGSTNGTYVDRVKIVEAELVGGELVRIGSTVLRVDRKDAATAAEAPVSPGFGRVVGESPEIRRLLPLCHRIASTDVPVIIEGETGTGKEVVAESIHEQSARARKPFVVLDCTTVSPALMENELFGHEKGAFTGATSSYRGVFEQAAGGTLFIDEIGDLELSLQPKLLRAIERSEIRRVGGDRWLRLDVRVVAATRRNLDREVEAGRFRDDLFHRLAVARVELPPLRHRRGDVAVLAQHFWTAFAGPPPGPPPDVLAKWQDYAWPGNIRELRNAVARQVALGDMAVGDPHVEPPNGLPVDANAELKGDLFERAVTMPFREGRDLLVDAFLLAYIQRALDQHDGDVAKAATASGIGVRYFQRLRARTR
jgi:DNA-binding NtrC family response regulator